MVMTGDHPRMSVAVTPLESEARRRLGGEFELRKLLELAGQARAAAAHGWLAQARLDGVVECAIRDGPGGRRGSSDLLIASAPTAVRRPVDAPAANAVSTPPSRISREPAGRSVARATP